MIKKINSLKGVKKLSNQESKSITGGYEINDCVVDCIDAYVNCFISGGANCVTYRDACYARC